MLTYELKKAPGVPLYEALYRCIRADILSGKLARGEKLPSKRALAQNLEVSKVTVEGAYAQLLEEGYIRSEEKRGYFVDWDAHSAGAALTPRAPEPEKPTWPVDLTANDATGFPFSVWMRLQRQVMLDYGDKLLSPLPSNGYPELRTAIAEHLLEFRNLRVDPENILIGAGTDFLYNLLIQLLGREKIYAVEDPGYHKIRRIYHAGGVKCVSAPMDLQGVIPEALGEAQVLHCSPSHHFPTGIITPAKRRQQLLDWVCAEGEERYIIEDDYDTEFRFAAHPVPPLMGMDRAGRVIYMNTFSKTLAPSIRISYMILPPGLMGEFRARLGFYGCTVPSFEQYTLARFLSEGHFEKHLNRMRKFYRSRRNRVIELLRQSPFADRMTILEQDAGLHFLLKIDTELSDAELVARCERVGIRVKCLGEYYEETPPAWAEHCLVVNYSGLREQELELALDRLSKANG